MYRSDNRICYEKENENSFTAFADMEDLLEKLKILNYESDFIASLKMKPIHKYYFVCSKNPGEQFFLFSSLAAWLIQKTGKSFDRPQEYDDPNTTIANILEVVRENGDVNFPPNKLKQGMGEHVIFVLNHLADQALQSSNFMWEKAQTPKEVEEEDTDHIEDECEINLERVEEEMLAAYSDDSEEENLFHIRDFHDNKNAQKPELEISANVDLDAWKLELERVMPKLKITIKSDSRDWRSHLEQIKFYRSNFDQSLSMTKTKLNKLHDDISITLEKISNRERYINKELENVLDEYRLLKDQLTKVKENYRNISGGVTERTRQLANLTDKMETIKQQMEERGSSMTDGTPLVNIKKCIAKVTSEIIDMDIRIAILDCVLLQTKIREKSILEQDLYQTLKMY